MKKWFKDKKAQIKEHIQERIKNKYNIIFRG